MGALALDPSSEDPRSKARGTSASAPAPGSLTIGEGETPRGRGRDEAKRAPFRTEMGKMGWMRIPICRACGMPPFLERCRARSLRCIRRPAHKPELTPGRLQVCQSLTKSLGG